MNDLPQEHTQFSRTCRNTCKLISAPKYNCIYNLLLYIMYALIKMYGKKMAWYLSFFNYLSLHLSWMISDKMKFVLGSHSGLEHVCSMEQN